MTSLHGTGPTPDTTIRLRGPGDVVAALPYHLGYRPEDSQLVIALDGSTVGFVARIDLPPDDVDPWEAVREVAPAVLRQRPRRVLLVAYESTPGRSEAFGAAVRGVLLDAGIEVAERLVVRGNRIYTPDCRLPCCPPEGQEVPGAADVPAVADYVLLGRAPVGARSDLDGLLAPGPAAAARSGPTADLADRVRDVCRRSRRRPGGALPRARGDRPAARAELADLRRRALTEWAGLIGDRSSGAVEAGRGASGQGWSPDGPGDPGVDRAVVLAASLRDVTLRDLVIAWLCPGTLDVGVLDRGLVDLAHELLPPPEAPAGEAAALTARLTALCRAVPEAESAPVLTVLANVAWWSGDGALARTALDRALRHEDDYRLALLLERLVDLAVPPRHAA